MEAVMILLMGFCKENLFMHGITRIIWHVDRGEGVKIDMQEKGWSLEYKLMAFIPGEEIERRLKNVTILKSQKNIITNLHILLNLNDYLFVAGEMTNKDFTFRINSNRMPPRGTSNPFLPKICGEITEDIQGECIVVFQLRKVQNG